MWHGHWHPAKICNFFQKCGDQKRGITARPKCDTMTRTLSTLKSGVKTFYMDVYNISVTVRHIKSHIRQHNKLLIKNKTWAHTFGWKSVAQHKDRNMLGVINSFCMLQQSICSHTHTHTVPCTCNNTIPANRSRRPVSFVHGQDPRSGDRGVGIVREAEQP